MSFLDDWQLCPLSLEQASGFTPIGRLVALLIAVAVINPGGASAVAVGVLVAGAAFAIRGYSLMGDQLVIHSLGRATKFDLAELTPVEASPGPSRALCGPWASVGSLALWDTSTTRLWAPTTPMPITGSTRW